MIHINRFLDRIKAAEAKNQRNGANFPMTVGEAKDLHTDITRLLLGVQALQEQLADQQAMPNEPVFKVEVTGGDFS